MKKFTFIFLLFSQIATAQNAQIKDVIKKIEIKEDTIKSVYDWVTNNIRYDVALLAKRNSKNYKPPKFKNQAERKQHVLDRVLTRKKGVCQHYAELFNSIVSELGYEGFVVAGMSKNSKGKLNREVGHAWNAVKVNGSWTLYDTTWGAGGVSDGKFKRRYTDRWYDTTPTEMIVHHMPFDPIWQLTDTPVAYAKFTERNSDIKLKKLSNTSAIDKYLKQDEKTQLQAQLDRSNKMGDGIRLLTNWRKRRQKFLDGYAIYNNPNLFKDTNAKCKASTDLLNEYIKAKNKKFKGKKWTVDYAEKSLLQINEQLNDALDFYKGTDVKDAKMKNSIRKSVTQVEKLLRKVDTELKFLGKLKG